MTKAELRQHVWAGTHVTDTVLRVCIRDIRAALDDAAAAPRYLETVGGQGYRWLRAGRRSVPPPGCGGTHCGTPAAKSRPWQGGSSAPPQATASSSSSVVKRGLARRRCWTCGWPACATEREVRIGAGTVRRALRGGRAVPALVGRRWGSLSRGPAALDVLAVLRRYAPMWLMQLPGLVSEAELEQLQRQVQGATPARMLRELCRGARRTDRRQAAGAGARRLALE